MFVLAGLLAILILQVDFGPGASFPAYLLALVASLAVGLAFIMRLLGAVLGHRTLPRRRPRIVPIALWRWLFPIALVVAANMLASARAPRAIAFWLDRTILEPLAVGPAVEPSRWSAVRAWSGSVTQGAVWNDIEVATIEWTPPEKGARDPIQGGYGLEWKSDEVHYTAAGGEEKIAPIVRISLPRLAVFPINGIGYAGSSIAWAYAPGAPDVFLPIPTGPDEMLRYRFVRHEGDWFVSRGLLISLRDRP